MVTSAFYYQVRTLLMYFEGSLNPHLSPSISNISCVVQRDVGGLCSAVDLNCGELLSTRSRDTD